MIERRSITVNVPEGSNADYYIPDEIANCLFDNGITQEQVITINEKDKDGIYTISIYYIKG
ncbi:MAG: hypothetical protein DRH57_07190 [Candidatus Cloacimonadota bacterium]|nr:MAG: hypothetical protein DRH57_07190 [Candidatus Cloacimonadota bacterium]